MNIGFEEDDLKPFIEPSKEYNDPARIGKSDLSECVSFILVSYTCDPCKHPCPRCNLLTGLYFIFRPTRLQQSLMQQQLFIEMLVQRETNIDLLKIFRHLKINFGLKVCNSR